ncbi:MAG: S-layer homology domain-containing protein, partial [Bacillota bacterium]
MRLKRRIRHRILALGLSLALILSLSFSMPVTSYASGNFPDTTGHWAEGFITRAFNKDIVDGYPNGRFMPDKSVTRAEFVSMVNKAFDIEGSSYETRFSDVTYSYWYYNDVLAATSTTYAGGYNDDTFRPNAPITRQEAAVMLSRILPSYKKSGNLKSFRDYRQIDSWATSAFEKLIGRQYMGAYSDGKLHPKDPLTRAQTAKILCDILDNETIITRSTIIDEDKAKITEKIYTDDVIISENLEEGSVTIDNCVILGDLTVEGGGNGTVTINNTRVASAFVNKDDSPVRIVTKGDTTIASLSAKQACVLQTSGKNGTGIQKITVNKGAELALKGSFPVVNIEGFSTVSLESGTITTLTISKSGKYSDITLTGKAEITEATVNAESYFHGAGTIAHMNVNADDITYETKPEKMTVATFVDRAMGEADLNNDVDITFKPKTKASDVNLDTEIYVTFGTSMKLANGSAITDSNINSFLSLRIGSKSGDTVDFTAKINSAKKMITITPKSDLNSNTKYYVVLTADKLKNASGNENDSAYSYFTTGTKSS